MVPVVRDFVKATSGQYTLVKVCALWVISFLSCCTVLWHCVKVGCSRDNAIECMQEKPTELLTTMQWLVQQGSELTFIPTVDDTFLTKSPAELMQYPGEFQRKDILQGVNSHEGGLFVFLAFPDHFDLTKEYNDNVTSEEYRDMVKLLLNTSSDVVADTIASIYSLPCGSQGNTGDDDGVNYFIALDGIFGDIYFKCPALETARLYAREVI